MKNNITKLPNDLVVLDTETTGFDPESGDRIVEIGAIKMRDGVPTNEKYHVYVNPERPVPLEAFNVHGLSSQFLSQFEPFEYVVEGLLQFIGDMPIAAHNAKFDAKFLNFELEKAGYQGFDPERIFDTLDVAKKLHPGSQANLDALCRRYNISLKNRDKHGALIDSELLAEVILEMGGGRQTTLFGNFSTKETSTEKTEINRQVFDTKVILPTDEEIERHNNLVKKLGDKAIWNQLH